MHLSSLSGRSAARSRITLSFFGFSVAAISTFCSFAGAATVVSYSSFPASSAGSLALNGVAQTGVTSDVGDVDTLRLMPTDSSFIFGTAFGKTPVLASAGFSTRFQFRITAPDGLSDGTEPGGDGMTFTIQNASSGAGTSGSGIGYQNIPNSVAVKFDTFQNPDVSDPSSNYLGIATNGNIDNASYPGGQKTLSTNFDNGTVWTSWIDYDGTTLSVYAVDAATNVKPGTALLSYPVNLASLLGASTGYVGFTTASGRAFENVYVLNWTYDNAFNVPEPTGLTLLVGTLGVLTRRRTARGN